MVFQSIFYQNVRGLNTKISQVRMFANASEFDLISFTETWLSESVSSSEIFNQRYQVFRRDRGSRGGGSLTAVKSDIIAMRMNDFECADSDDVWIRLKTNEGYLYVCTVYLPPHNAHSIPLIQNFLKQTYDNLSRIEDSAKVLILGDFNMKHLTWTRSESLHLEPSGYEGRDVYEDLIDIMNCFGIENFNCIPNRDSRFLDLILSNVSLGQIDLKVSHVQACRIDHYHPPLELTCTLECSRNLPVEDYPRYDFQRTDYERLNHAIRDHDWSPLLTLNTDDATSYFYDSIFALIDQHVPLKPKCGVYPIWYSTRLVRLVNLKMRYHTLWKKYGTVYYHELFKKLRSDQNRTEILDFAKFTRHVESNLHSKLKEFWLFTKSIRKTNTYPNHIELDGHSETEAKKIADLFATSFSGIYENAPNPQLMPSFEFVTDCTLSNIFVHELEIQKILKSLDCNKGPGSDGISAKFLKETSLSISFPLSCLFQRSLDEGIFPSFLKTTKIFPVFKKGDPSLVSNYRPIAILNCIEKIFERLVHNRLFEYVRPFLNPAQHAFQKGRSTTTNLLDHLIFISDALNNRERVDVVYTDLSKAFDLVNHAILALKLRSFGITGALLDWFKSYLGNRPVYVTFNGSKSFTFQPTCGVPQGSIIGPLLFILYMNDSTRELSCTSSLYADDVKICRIVRDELDNQQLQTDLSLFEGWCNTNCFQLNPSKCFVVSFSNKLETYHPSYNICSQPIPFVHDFRDLGVTFDAKMRFDVHIDGLVKKAFRTLGFLIRTSRSFRRIETIVYLYNTLVRSQLEYCTIVWSPFYKIYINRIEKIQRFFTRFVFRKFNIPYIGYNRRLSILGMDSLAFRRLITDGVYLYKLMTGMVKSAATHAISTRTNIHNVRNMGVFGIKTYNINTSHFSYIPRISRIFNLLFNHRNIFFLNLHEFRQLWIDKLRSVDLDCFENVLELFSVQV